MCGGEGRINGCMGGGGNENRKEELLRGTEKYDIMFWEEKK